MVKEQDNKIITRFAPSPTGILHIGGARTALFSWLYAKSLGGDCLLRIEDTDLERSKDEYTAEIIKSFKWIGIIFDGEPVYQSKNIDKHNQIIDRLLKEKNAYVCQCTEERLSKLRKELQKQGLNPKYDGKCRELGLEKEAGSVIRFKIPLEGSIIFNDLVKGRIEISNTELDDLIIQRGDETPTYNLSVVVDDIDMKVSHVIRGDDHLNNTPKQIHIFNALNQDVPVYGHVPMILGEDGKRLSKRHGAIGIREYKDLGILPDALRNYLVRLGWSLGDKELFNEQDLIDSFQEGTLNSSPASFSEEKLLWFNKSFLDKLNNAELSKILDKDYLDNSVYANEVLDLVKDRCHTLNDFLKETFYFFNELNEFPEEELRKIISGQAESILIHLRDHLKTLNEWNSKTVKNVLDSTTKEFEVGFSKVGIPLRYCLTGQTKSPSIDLVCKILGKEKVLERIQKVINLSNS